MKREELEREAQLVRKGKSVSEYKNQEVIDLQDYALSINDIDLYDKLQKYWGLKNFSI